MGPASNSDFVMTVFNVLREDSIGTKCREDWVILEVGYRKYLDKKHDQFKKYETSENIRSDMCLLARVTIEFNQLSGLKTEDMFLQKNYKFLEKAIDQII